MASLQFFQIDAFTNSKFSGNPAGVIFCGNEWPENIQEIASEINQTETAFIKLTAENYSFHQEAYNYVQNDHFDLKWLTPTRNVQSRVVPLLDSQNRHGLQNNEI